MSAFGTKRHSVTEFRCPLLGVKRTSQECAAMSAFDPKRTTEPQSASFKPSHEGETCNGANSSLYSAQLQLCLSWRVPSKMSACGASLYSRAQQQTIRTVRPASRHSSKR